MAKVKFPLDMGNDVLVRNIDELKENFNVEKVAEYFLNGKLLTWLNDRYYDEEAEQVETLSSESDKSLISSSLCKIFGIEIEDEVDVEALERRRERLEKLRSITSDDAVLKNVDSVAFSQEELGDLLDEDIDEIYLCGDKFRIPLSMKNKRYIGVNKPVVDISTKDDKIDLTKWGIIVEKCDFSEKTQAKLKKKAVGIVEVERADVEDDYDIFDIVFDEEDDDYNTDEVMQSDTRPYKELNVENVTEIIIPEGTKRIGECAFRGFTHLKNIKIPDSVTYIGACAFEYCKSLEKLIIPNSVTEIECSAFENCAKLKDVKLSESIDKITRRLFNECGELTTITIPDGVTEIYEHAFSSCKKLEEVVLPNSLTQIGEGAFGYLPELKGIDIPNGVTIIGENAFSSCEKLEYVNFSDSVTEIGEWAFSSCNNLRSVIIPDSVIQIGESAFYMCENLENVTLSRGITTIEDGVFGKCKSLSAITIPDGVTKICEYAFKQCESLTSIKIPDSVKELGSYAFSECKNLKEARLSKNMSDTGWEAFDKCEKLTSVIIPEGIHEIVESFRGTAIVSLTIPQSVPYDSFGSLESITSLKECNLPISYKKEIEEALEFGFSRVPDGCKINYYSGSAPTSAISDKEKQSMLVKYFKDNSYKTGLKTYSWFYGSQISSTAKNSIKDKVKGLNKTSAIVAAYDKNLSLFSNECKGNNGIVFTTEGFAVYEASILLNYGTPLIKYEEFDFLTKDGSSYTIWLKNSDRTYSLFAEDTFDEYGFEELISGIVNMDYAK